MKVFAEKLSDDNSIIDLMLTLDPEDYRTVDIPRKVGFDKITVGLNILEIDWSLLERVVKEENGKSMNITIRSCRDEEKILAICENEPQEHWYSEIRIQFASNVFTMRKCNLPGCRDICLFEICIPPLEGHEGLGNISNLSCEQEQIRVRDMMKRLQLCGIYADIDYADLKKVELNVNLFLVEKHIGFKDAVEMIRPHRHGLNRFKFSDYSEPSKQDEYYIKIKPQQYEFLGIKEKKKTSFSSVGKSMTIKVYDKSVETMTKSMGYIDWMSPITRIEFTIDSAKEIPYYLGSSDLFRVKQEDIESAFCRLAERLIRQPLLEYYRSITYAFEKYFENIDISEHAWRKNAVMELDNTIKRTDDFFIMSYDELVRLVGLIPAPSVKKNRARIAKSLRDEFIEREATCIRIADECNIDLLLDWLCSIQGEESQSIIYHTNP